jgi:Mn2+/Fe2+ NRAMP family transporter
LGLFAYVATAFVADVPWLEVLHQLVLPKVVLSKDYIVTMVAILGTTISPYLFFWQAAQEVEDTKAKPIEQPLSHSSGSFAPCQCCARRQERVYPSRFFVNAQ